MVFLEQDVDAPLGNRISRWWAGYNRPGNVYLPLVMVDSGHQISSGSQADFKAAYRRLVDAELVRPPQAEIEAYTRQVGAKMRVYARLRNTSDTSLSDLNYAALHALIWEDRRVGVTGRIVRAAPWLAISPAVAPGGEFTVTLETSDLSGVTWGALHTVVVADVVPGSGPAYDMLQGALAEPVALSADPRTVSLIVDANGQGDPSVPVHLRGPYVLSWTASADVPWISLTPGSGAISAQPTLAVTAGRLSPGWQQGVATFSASSEDGMSLAETVAVRAFLGSRVLRVGSATAARGDRVTLPVELSALGDENTVRFSLAFDPAVLAGPSVAAGPDADGATLTVDDTQVAGGRLGVVVALPSGQTFDQSQRQLVVVSLAVASGALGSTSVIRFADQPSTRQVEDGEGNGLSATFLDGAVTLVGAPVVRPPRRHLPAGP